MTHEILTPAEMSEADAATIKAGIHDGYRLMRNAGNAIARHLLRYYGDASEFHVLCGPGNNGGDGYVVAEILECSGASVRLWATCQPKPGTDAALAAKACPVDAKDISDFTPSPGSVIVDALFGAGLNRELSGKAAAAIKSANEPGCHRVAIDVPSGLDGLTGHVLGTALNADATITFFRKKPAHLLYPGRTLCGEVIVADIGIADDVLNAIEPRCFENTPALWQSQLPRTEENTHKYARGHVAVFSGGSTSTGAARMSALTAARSGAGAVTLLSPEEALAANAAHLTSIMLHKCENRHDLALFTETRKVAAFVLGPAFGIGVKAREFALALLSETDAGLVFDADVITSFKDERDALFDATARLDDIRLVLTPHEGEFKRLFPEINQTAMPSKVERARAAAKLAGAIIIYKGADTVIASPDGRAAINSNGTPLLATAGSGDVLAGLTAGLLAQGMPTFEAACAAVFVHGAAAHALGFGLIAEDLPAAAGKIIGQLLANKPTF
ncbi:bifunctional ADP-dependent NAD(P)H-hydrate dehydratase/NAD(P)H-hydrate epimerase [Phyllobacterium sp. YR531]|uniref:bifunctional ADP-dependent NAD(P)H-hydrate dehydratase/NAD(P)H-hydrate epimerase n=1 Tax=Phyllobacterium sp. YR531 TaxID=1144343 RepID=UPI00026F75A6|nr:bifunctional ADP-dependent NAD(P)H-hydrate dehydratase/NAD(P)H-hydrate epimerase [Phyllobacterium sp. YR531]EJN01643.1 yjeF-like protein, hydroxyethylthiazole kinase-related protein [Phyllobacterium sp. YR531]